MPFEVFYWEGVIAEKEIHEEFRETIQKLREGNYRAVSLEKLANHNVYSARINASDRLLLTTITVRGKSYLLILEVIRNHDYQKSRFLKPAVLKNYLELNQELIAETIIDDINFIPVEEPFLSVDDRESEITFSAMTYYNRKFIQLNQTQNEARQVPLPLVVTGAAGSGKSCVALSLLEQYVLEKWQERTGKPIVYVGPKLLVSHMQALWNELPASQDEHAHLVQFKSYIELPQVAQHIEGKVLVGETECLLWLDGYLKKNRTIQKARKEKKVEGDFLKNPLEIYQEFKIIAAHHTKEKYFALGYKQSLFHTPEQKKWIFSAYQSYLDSLTMLNQFDLSLCAIPASEDYDLMVVDESQDLPLLALKNLFNFVVNNQICFCQDTRQLTSDNKSKLPFLLNMLQQKVGKEVHIDLPYSYRSPNVIADFANLVIDLRTRLTGGTADKQELPEIKVAEDHKHLMGELMWITPDLMTLELKEQIRAWAQTTNFAVVTLEAYKEQARELFGTPLVFTAEEIKGFEYKFVVGFRLLDDPICEQANRKLRQSALESGKKMTHRAKKNSEEEKFAPPMNKLFTAITRATNRFILFQEKSHELDSIISFLERGIVDSQFMSAETFSPSTQKDWEKEAEKLREGGQIEQADSISRDKLFCKIHEHAEEDPRVKLVEISKKENFTIVPKEKGKQTLLTKKKSTLFSHDKTIKTSIGNVGDDRGSKRDEITSTISPIKLDNPSPVKVVVPGGLKRFAEIVYNNCTINNLKKLFSYPKFANVLFDGLFDDGTSLISKLAKDPKKIKVLLDFIMTKPAELNIPLLCQFSKKPEKNAVSLIYAFTYASEFHPILVALFKIYPEISEAISEEILCESVNSDSFMEVSSLFWFVFNDVTINLLKEIIQNNPSFCDRINSEALCRSSIMNLPGSTLRGRNGCSIRDYLEGIDYNKNPISMSPFYLLTNRQEGRTLLKEILKTNPEFSKKVTADALCNRVGELDQKSKPHIFTALYWLCLEEPSILKTLLLFNPTLCSEIPAKAWLFQVEQGKRTVSPYTLLNRSEENDIIELISPEIKLEIVRKETIRSSKKKPSFFLEEDKSSKKSESSTEVELNL